MYFITIKRMLEVCFSAHPNIQYRAGILDRNAVGYFWDWKKVLAVSGAVESYLVILLR